MRTTSLSRHLPECSLHLGLLLLLLLVGGGHHHHYGVDAYWDGIASVDTSTFDKVVTNESTTIVKIDVKHPHGPFMDEWRAFAKAIGELGAAAVDMLPAEVNCHHEWWWNDETYFNMDLAHRFGVSFHTASAEGVDFRPKILLFRKGALFHKPVVFQDAVSSANLLRLVQKYASRSFLNLPGTLRCLDAEAAVMLHLDPQQGKAMGDGSGAALSRTAVLKRAEAIVRERRLLPRTKGPLRLNWTLALDEETAAETCEAELSKLDVDPQRKADADYYLSIMKRLAAADGAGGSDVSNANNAAINEKARITRILNDIAKGASGPDKKKKLDKKTLAETDRLERNLNILSTFRSAASVDMADEAAVRAVAAARRAALAARRAQYGKRS